MILAAGIYSVLMLMATCLVVFFAVALAIYGLFNQPVEVRLSFQREAAILAGQTDRQTIFEIEFLRPIMWVMLALASDLAMPRLKESVRRSLVAGGNPNYYSVNEYISLSLLTMTSLVLLVAVGRWMDSDTSTLATILMVGFVGVLGFAVPIFHLHSVAGRRVRQISRKVPYALDLIALSMGAGATFTEAVRTLVREDPTDEFGKELSQVLAEVELGKTRNEALMNMTERIPLESLKAIVGAIIQAESLGTPLTDVLKAQSNLLRHQRSVRAEKLAATASVRILIPSVLILIGVVIIVFAPVMLNFIRSGGNLF